MDPEKVKDGVKDPWKATTSSWFPFLLVGEHGRLEVWNAPLFCGGRKEL